jgi:acetyl esterase
MAQPFDRLNEQTRALLDNIARAGFPPLHTLPMEQARLSYRMGIGASTIRPVALPRVEDFTIPGPSGHAIAARLYAPSTEPHLPVMLYMHGGGFVIGSIDTCDAMCRSVAQQAGVAVVAIDYRLAPEHKFPAGLHDAWDAFQWLAREAHTLGLDASRLAVGGDSAGATLAATVALMARDAGLPLRLQALFYPSVQTSMVTDSFKAFAKGLILDSSVMAWFDANARQAGVPDDWHREPLKAASHQGVAPAWISVAECDPLADDGRLYADKLKAEGVPAELVVWPGTVHDFINLGRFIPQAAQAHTALAQALRQALLA